MKEIDELTADAFLIAKTHRIEHLVSCRIKFLKYYRHSLILPNGRRANADEIQWCIDNCSGYVSQDHTCTPFSFSFEKKDDMVLFKLTFGIGRLRHV